MSKFRKKPVVIDAVRWNGEVIGLTNGGNSPVITVDDPAYDPALPMERLEMPDWLPAAKVVPDSPFNTGEQVPAGEVWRVHDTLYIGTLEGTHRCEAGNWIIRGVQGEIYPCDPDIFAATYEAVDHDHP